MWFAFLPTFCALPTCNFYLSTLFQTVEKLPFRTQWLVKGSGAVLLLGATVVWIVHVGIQPKFVFNARSPYAAAVAADFFASFGRV